VITSPNSGPSVGESAVTKRPRLSVVIPVFEEEETISELHRRLSAVLRRLAVPYEIIFVDDGSRDRSFAILEELHHNDPRITVLRLSRNFGHHLALTAGLDASTGETVVMMDGDLQDPPEEIPPLLCKLDEGYDVVYGVRSQSQHSLFKRVTSRLFFAFMGWLVRDFQLNTGIFRVARRPVIDTVTACRETNRLVLGLVSWAGFRQTGISVQHHPRQAGVTKYTLAKQLRLAFNTITSFTMIPLRFSTYLGLSVAVIAFIYGGVVLARKLIWGLGEVGWPSLIFVTLFLGAVQLLSLGIFGEYLGRILIECQRRPLYVVARCLARDDDVENI
jgi:polyisoprenyl-phosphate glycosyltransferase